MTRSKVFRVIIEDLESAINQFLWNNREANIEAISISQIVFDSRVVTTLCTN